MNNKKKVIIISISICVALIGVIIGIFIFNNIESDKKSIPVNTSKNVSTNETDNDILTDAEKAIAGLSTDNNEDSYESEKNYSELYKEFLKLPKEEQEKSEVIPRKENIPFEKIEEIKDKLDENDANNSDEIPEEKIPDKFNLADVINIKVEDQRMFGLCWDFASIKALETYLSLNKLGDYDFSEMHLDYIESDLMYGERKLHDGGNFENFKNYVSESGVVLEESVPYTYNDFSEEEYTKFADMKSVVNVTETVDFPTMYKIDYNKFTGEQISDFRNTVKKHIMKNGGIYASVVGYGGDSYYVPIDSDEFTNHAVTIVGWDDNYSKDNFASKDGKKPNKDGAYIALNSWSDLSNNLGYYYISYEDKYVESDMCGIISTSLDNAYKVNSIKSQAIKDYLKANYR